MKTQKTPNGENVDHKLRLNQMAGRHRNHGLSNFNYNPNRLRINHELVNRPYSVLSLSFFAIFFLLSVITDILILFSFKILLSFEENLSGLPVVKISPEWVTGPEQGKSSGRVATFSLWTGLFRV